MAFIWHLWGMFASGTYDHSMVNNSSIFLIFSPAYLSAEPEGSHFCEVSIFTVIVFFIVYLLSLACKLTFLIELLGGI